MRGLLQFSQNEVPKRAFRAILPTIFTRKKASKRIVSCEASSKFHRRSFQNERFVRGFLQNFTRTHASKTSVSHEASDNFARKSFQNDRFVRGFFQNFTENKASKTSVSRDASDNFHEKICVSLQFRAIDTPLSCERVSSAKSKMCLALQRRAFPNFKMYVSLQRRAQKCMKSIHREPTRFAHTKNVTFYYSFGRSTPRFYREG